MNIKPLLACVALLGLTTNSYAQAVDDAQAAHGRQIDALIAAGRAALEHARAVSRQSPAERSTSLFLIPANATLNQPLRDAIQKAQTSLTEVTLNLHQASPPPQVTQLITQASERLQRAQTAVMGGEVANIPSPNNAETASAVPPQSSYVLNMRRLQVASDELGAAKNRLSECVSELTASQAAPSALITSLNGAVQDVSQAGNLAATLLNQASHRDDPPVLQGTPEEIRARLEQQFADRAAEDQRRLAEAEATIRETEAHMARMSAQIQARLEANRQRQREDQERIGRAQRQGK